MGDYSSEEIQRAYRIVQEQESARRVHTVTFYSPGTFVHEESCVEVDSWDIDQAVEMARGITERHGATPFSFVFKTHDGHGKKIDKSPRYFLGGTIKTLEDVIAENDPRNSILISNMRFNHIKRVIHNTNSYAATVEMDDDDIVLPFDAHPSPPQASTVESDGKR